MMLTRIAAPRLATGLLSPGSVPAVGSVPRPRRCRRTTPLRSEAARRSCCRRTRPRAGSAARHWQSRRGCRSDDRRPGTIRRGPPPHSCDSNEYGRIRARDPDSRDTAPAAGVLCIAAVTAEVQAAERDRVRTDRHQVRAAVGRSRRCTERAGALRHLQAIAAAADRAGRAEDRGVVDERAPTPRRGSASDTSASRRSRSSVETAARF